MFFNLHPSTKIAYKELTKADLGAETTHQTHIWLFEAAIDFITDLHQQSFAQFIYEDSVKELLSFIDPITTPSWKIRSPKIRSGSESELNILWIRINSIVKEIREIVWKNIEDTWYLIRFWLDNKDLVFFLIKKDSENYYSMRKIIGDLKNKDIIERSDNNFVEIINFLNNKINNLRIDYIQDLELVAQTGEENIEWYISTKPRTYDIEKAKSIFKEIGKKWEELVDKYLARLRSQRLINDYNRLNRDKESGMPYDFEIRSIEWLTQYTDVKSTSYKFEQSMIFSWQEFKFINQTPNFLIHRVFNIQESPKLKICNNINVLSKELLSNMYNFDVNVQKSWLKLNSIKIEVPPVLWVLNFENEILLTA
jgi:hypothetical protein